MEPRLVHRPARVGLIVNPIAGIGGRVALKGSDGEAARRALELGAVPEAGERARRAVGSLAATTMRTGPDLDGGGAAPDPRGRAARDARDAAALGPAVILLAAPAEMGEAPALEAGLRPVVVGEIAAGRTSAADTRRIAMSMRDAGLDLLLFAGGDGTARDVLDAVARTVPVLGIPAGVKVYSGVFAAGPERAGELAAAFLDGSVPEREAEVLDLDEDAYRAGRVSPSLHGYLRVPFRPDAIRGGKAPTPPGEAAAIEGIAAEVVARMDPRTAYALGPGTTTRAIARRLGLPKTLVGVDVVTTREVLAADATEARLLELAALRPLSIIVAPIGGQGFVFGRGNPQLGPRLLRTVSRERILVVATAAKLAGFAGRPLLVDTGDRAVDAGLAGHLRVVTGPGESAFYRVAS